MKLQDYSALKEIHSLDLMIKGHLDRISEQEQRIESIHQKRSEKEKMKVALKEEILRFQEEITKEEKLLFDLENKLKKTLEHIPMANSEKEINALEKEKEKLSPEVELIQERIIEKLELIEEREDQIRKATTFLQGSLETLQSIESEVQEIKSEEERSLGHYQERIEALLEEIPRELKNSFLKVREKFKYQRPLVRIIKHSCEFCHFQLDQLALEAVESLQRIETCSQCERLFIPLES